MPTELPRRNFLLLDNPELHVQLMSVLSDAQLPMEEVDERVGQLLLGVRRIVWEGDPQTFQFSYVSPSAEQLLGYPVSRWLEEPDFWCETVVHPQDRHDAVAFCAMATGLKYDHDFEYRAKAIDGRLLWLHDVVKVIVSDKNVPALLRGVMMDITDKRFAG